VTAWNTASTAPSNSSTSAQVPGVRALPSPDEQADHRSSQPFQSRGSGLAAGASARVIPSDAVSL
jgi:hypothetical protein